MYTNTKTMSLQERGDIPITALQYVYLHPGKPRNECLSTKLPRANLDQQDLLDQIRGAIEHGETLTAEGTYLWDICITFGRLRFRE